MRMSSLPRSSRLLACAALGVALMAFTGCVSMDEHKRLESAYAQSQDQLASAEADLQRLRKQVDDLNALLAKSDLSKDFAALKADRDRLAARVAELENLLAKSTAKMPGVINNALRDLAAMYPDLLEYDEALGMIRFKSDMTFDSGKTAVKPRAREALAKLAGILNHELIAQNEVRIVGHTDDAPIRPGTPTAAEHPNNWYLSTDRANAVRAVLTEDGVADTRVQPAGWGPSRPIAENAPGRKGNEKNRRVEVYILPTTVPANALSVPEPVAENRTPAPTTPRTPRTPARPTTPPTTIPAPTPTPTHPLPGPAM